MPTAVLVHGIASSGTTWLRAAEDLGDLGWNVLAPTMLGHHGRPTLPGDAPDPIGELADDVAASIDAAFGPVRLDLLLGHSLGALVVLRLVAKHPDRAKRVMIEDPPGLGGGIRPVDIIGDLRAESHAARTDPGGFADALAEANPAWSRIDVHQALANRQGLDDVGAQRFAETAHWDLPALVAASPVPVHLLVADGPETALVDPDRSVVLDALGADAVTAVRSGHSIHRDRPGLWLHAVTALVE